MMLILIFSFTLFVFFLHFPSKKGQKKRKKKSSINLLSTTKTSVKREKYTLPNKIYEDYSFFAYSQIGRYNAIRCVKKRVSVFLEKEVMRQDVQNVLKNNQVQNNRIKTYLLCRWFYFLSNFRCIFLFWICEWGYVSWNQY